MVEASDLQTQLSSEPGSQRSWETRATSPVPLVFSALSGSDAIVTSYSGVNRKKVLHPEKVQHELLPHS